MRRTLPIVLAMAFVPACATSPRQPDPGTLRQQVVETERAFARTMATRDFEGFTSLVSAEAIFLGGTNPLKGKRQIADGWQRYYEGADAPFSWEPGNVEVLESGTLALSTGPVHDVKGKLIGTFTSIWRLEGPGRWRIVFDTGNDVCDKP